MSIAYRVFRVGGGKIGNYLLIIICTSLLGLLIAQIVGQFLTPSLPRPLSIVQDIPLPSALPDTYRTPQHPLAPGLAVAFDHFDFQALDPQTHLLFIAHTGPNPDKERLVNPHFNLDTDVKTDGNIIIFDTLQNKPVRVLPIPQVTGIVAAPDLHKVYAADGFDDTIYVIDERTWKITTIDLLENNSPDAMEYDQRDHLIFVSNPGSPAHPDQSQVIDRKNQSETVIDARTDEVVATVPLGVDGSWGDDVGHVRFDPVLHRVFVVVQQLADPDSSAPNLLPPPGTARLVVINPQTYHVTTRLKLPDTCITPHGLAIDTVQHIAFIACVDADPASILRVDLRTMRVFAEAPWPVQIKPDIIVLDRGLHLVYVGCGAGISVFQEDGRAFKWLANYSFSYNTHTLAVNQETHQVYVPLPRVGGRPILRIMLYNTGRIT